MVDILEEIGEPIDASDWLIAMREQPDDPVLRRKFESWLLDDPANVLAWQEVSELGVMLGSVDAAIVSTKQHTPSPAARVPQGVFDRNSHQTLRSPKSAGRAPFARSPRIWGGLAAFAALVMLVVANDLPVLTPENVYQTTTAQTEVITLADQSKIDLAPDSKVEVTYREDRREVVLHQGTAFFDVTPNAQRPFVVSAQNVSVRVLGTAFEVSTDTVGDDVSVAEGLVEVRAVRSDKLAKLSVGDRVAVSDKDDWRQDRVQLETISAWRRGLIVAQNEPLGALVDQISDYYSGYVILNDDEIDLMEVSGVFDVSHPQRALEIIGQSHGLDVQTVTPWIIVISKK